MPREIITLQIGHYANFVGAHLWNQQQSLFTYNEQERKKSDINHDVLFREGKTLQGKTTFTPRLLAIDLKGSLRNLPQDGTLYEDGSGNKRRKYESDKTWDGEVQICGDSDVTPPASDKEGNSQMSVASSADESEPSQVGDDDVRVWSDFLRVNLHPRSLHIIDDFSYNMFSKESDFTTYSNGLSVVAEGRYSDMWEDGLRWFAEDCDQLQGFQVVSDISDGFSGVGCGLSLHLADEYRGKASITYPVIRGVLSTLTSPERHVEQLNMAMAFSHLTPNTDALVPLTTLTSLLRDGGNLAMPHLQYKHDVDHHTSAVLSAAVDNLTTPLRVYGRSAGSLPTMHQLIDGVVKRGQKVCASSVALPWEQREDESVLGMLGRCGDQLPLYSLTPLPAGTTSLTTLPTDLETLSVQLRGVTYNRSDAVDELKTMPEAVRSCESSEELVRYYLADVFPDITSEVYSIRDRYYSPFPPHVLSNPGGLPRASSSYTARQQQQQSSSTSSSSSSSLPMASCLWNSPAVGQMLYNVYKSTKSINIRRFHQFLADMEMDDYLESLDDIKKLAENYEISEMED